MFPCDASWREALNLTLNAVQNALDSDDYAFPVRPIYLRNAVNGYPRAGGKRMRPALTLWACGLFGGNPEKAFPAALATELYHNWTLVHDDLIDHDEFRRGVPTAHAAVREASRKEGLSSAQAELLGLSTAVLAGDVLHGWSVHTLCKLQKTNVSASCILALIERMQQDLGRGLISGEALDVDMSVRPLESLAPESVLEMMTLKTGVLLRFAAQSGAAVAFDTADLNRLEIVEIGRFAEHLGVAFQLHDDWLGLFGDAQKLGKPIGSDLIAAKPTLLMTEALKRLPDIQRVELLALTGTPDIGEKELIRARELILESGAELFTRNRAQEYILSAKEALLSFPDNCYRRWLLDLADYAVSREK